jgi:hypothetical protein
MPILLCGSECGTSSKQQINKIEIAEMRFFRAGAVEPLLDKKSSEAARKLLL